MARGTGKQAQQAASSGKLFDYVKGGTGGEDSRSLEWIDWAEVEPRLISGAVWAVNKEGGSILFGHSRDKSSYSIMLFSGDLRKPYYFPANASGIDALHEFLEGLIRVADSEA